MICNNCGRQIQNETANFCEYCGYSFREHAQGVQPQAGQSFSNIQGTRQEAFQTLHPSSISGIAGGTPEKSIGFMGWLGTYAVLAALLFVPFGWILLLALLIFWAFSNKIPATKRNWARVTLIFLPIIVLYLALLFMAFYNLYSQLIVDGAFDFSNYYNMVKSLQ